MPLTRTRSHFIRVCSLTVAAAPARALSLRVRTVPEGVEALGLLVVTLTDGLVGMLIGVVAGRLVGLWSVLVATMLDIGLFQDPMFTMGEPA